MDWVDVFQILVLFFGIIIGLCILLDFISKIDS